MAKFSIVTSNEPDPVPVGNAFRVVSAPPADSEYATKQDILDLENKILLKTHFHPTTSGTLDFCLVLDGGNASSSNCSGY